MENSYLQSFKLHSTPKDQKIALVIIYTDLYIVYNRFGQRIGAQLFTEVEHHIVFYNTEEIIVADNQSYVSKFNFKFWEKRISKPVKIDHFFINPDYIRAEAVFTNLFFKHQENAIYSFFDVLIENWVELNKLNLTEKYQKENLLDMIAICKIMNFEKITETTINTFTKRIGREINLEINNLNNKNFESVSDILYDEILQFPILQNLNSIPRNF